MSEISIDTIPESLQVTPPTPHERIASALERIADAMEKQADPLPRATYVFGTGGADIPLTGLTPVTTPET